MRVFVDTGGVVKRTEPFRRQHAELGQLGSKIASSLDARALLTNGAHMRQMLLTMARSLADHAEQEDEQLYASLFRDGDAKARAKARQLRDEFGVIYGTVECYLSIWSRPGAIEEDAAHFVRETKGVLATLGKRIQRENEELYTMIDALPDVSLNATPNAPPDAPLDEPRDAPAESTWRAKAAAFAAEATRFSQLMQDAGGLTTEERTERLAQQLASLYAAAVALPRVDEPAARATRVVSGETTTELGPWVGLSAQQYWQVFDPFVNEPPVVGDLDADVCYILDEVRLGLDEWNKGRQQHAAFQWRESFDERWGERVVDVLRAMHWLVESLRR